MELKEAREIVGGYQKLPADRYQEAVDLCIEDDGKKDDGKKEKSDED